MQEDIFVCRGLNLMNYLVREGFDCKKVKKDNKNPDYVVFCFADTKELRDSLDRYFKQ